jgi:hypothetical protein
MTLAKTNLDEFFERALRADHSEQRLRAGEVLCSYMTLQSIDAARDLMSTATDAQRAARREVYFNEALLARQRLGQGVHDRGEAVAMTGGELSESDWAGLKNHLPLHVKVISVLDKTLEGDEDWDVSVRSDIWGLDYMEELYVLVNIGNLRMAPGSSLAVRGNVFSLICQCITTSNNPDDWQVPPTEIPRISILPTPFAVDFRGPDLPHNGLPGNAGTHGEAGRDGEKVLLGSSLFGQIAIGDHHGLRMDGSDGQPGNNGGNGQRGRNGGMCKTAEITIRRLEGKLAVFSQGGDGGRGGDGGAGGKGGNGGNGSHGSRAIGGVISGGRGGDGGNGGNGGRGGRGGNSGLSSNIFVTIPDHQEDLINGISLPGNPGAGGQSGKGGLAGVQGRGGKGPGEAFNGSDGKHGKPGSNGPSGHMGRQRAAANIFLNERILTTLPQTRRVFASCQH